jgi:hypothetical protein
LAHFKFQDVALNTFYGKFHGIAADLTVLHIGLRRYRGIDKGRNGFPAIRTLEKILDHPA